MQQRVLTWLPQRGDLVEQDVQGGRLVVPVIRVVVRLPVLELGIVV